MGLTLGLGVILPPTLSVPIPAAIGSFNDARRTEPSFSEISPVRLGAPWDVSHVQPICLKYERLTGYKDQKVFDAKPSPGICVRLSFTLGYFSQLGRLKVSRDK